MAVWRFQQRLEGEAQRLVGTLVGCSKLERQGLGPVDGEEVLVVRRRRVHVEARGDEVLEARRRPIFKGVDSHLIVQRAAGEELRVWGERHRQDAVWRGILEGVLEPWGRPAPRRPPPSGRAGEKLRVRRERPRGDRARRVCEGVLEPWGCPAPGS